CANASAVALGPLESTCYALQDAARWYHPKERCAQLEFELLRLSAQVASRPGHLLLIQSLQRAFRGIADRLLPFMGGDVMRQWVICALDALYARDVQALQHQLPALMKTYDELVLDQFAPVPREQAAPEAHHAQEGSPGAPASDSAQDQVPETNSCVALHDPVDPAPANAQDDAFEPRLDVDERGLGYLAPAVEGSETLGVYLCPQQEALAGKPECEAPRFPAASGCIPRGSTGECAARNVPGVASGNRSDCRTGWDASSPEGGFQLEAPHAGSLGAVREEGGLLRGTWIPSGQWAVRLWRFIAHSLGLPAS
ncbi:GntR family transcriptional regulator, partial [Corallococcus aberystwythensis]